MLLKKIKLLIPFLILFALFALLWRELFYAKPKELPSALLGEPVPTFQLPNLFAAGKPFSQQDLIHTPQHQVVLLNIWATWCYACSLEQPMLMKIKQQYHVPIYSIDYKDHPAEAAAWLEKYGNPYVMTGSDLQGDAAIDLGVYGTPETFVVSPQGKIIYRQIGAINDEIWNKILYPLIKKYEGAQ